MATRQARYKQTEKGKQKQAESQRRYLESTESWQTFIPLELSEELKKHIPPGVSKSQFLKQLLVDYLSRKSQ